MREREKGEDAVYIVGKWKSWFYISTRGGPKRESAVIYICTDSAGVGGKTMKYRIDAVVRIQKNMTHLFLLGFSINSNNFFQTWNLAYSFTLARVKHPLRANTKKRSPSDALFKHGRRLLGVVNCWGILSRSKSVCSQNKGSGLPTFENRTGVLRFITMHRISWQRPSVSVLLEI